MIRQRPTRICTQGAKNYAGIDCFADKCSKKECRIHPNCTNCEIQLWLIHHKQRYVIDTENETVGIGIKAICRIFKGQIIHVQMLSHPVPPKDMEKNRYYVKHGQDSFALDQFGSTVNHSCNPNVVMEKWEIPTTTAEYHRAIVFRAWKEIRSQKFLHFTYNSDAITSLGKTVCACMRSNCRLFIGVGVAEPPKWTLRNTKCKVVGCLNRSRFSGKCRAHSTCKKCGKWKSNKSKPYCRECELQ